MGVEARRHQHQVGREGPRRRHRHVLHQPEPLLLPGARGHRQVDREALAGARPCVRRARRSRARTATGGGSRTGPRAQASKIACVPLPWCTSQSSTSTRSAAERSRGRGARRRPRWRTGRSPSRARARRGGPAGAARRTPWARRPRPAPRPARTPRPRRAAPPPRSPGWWGCPGRRPHLARSGRAPTRRTTRGCTRRSCSIAARGASRTLVAEPVALLQQRLDGADPVRSLGMGARVVAERSVVAEEERRADRVTVPAVQWVAPPPHRSAPM